MDFIGNIGSSRARLPPITRHSFTWIEESKQACRLSSANTAAYAMILAIANVRLPQGLLQSRRNYLLVDGLLSMAPGPKQAG